ncbi:MAG TPA: peroxiredoxin [Gemmataceae bacterium]|nr:peroxiredoxin [Gemmataceae bacterium]
MRIAIKLGLAALLLGAFVLAPAAGRAAEKKEAEGVKVGDKAPTFEATDDQGKTWKSGDHVGKKFVVIYFYPADFTGGCTKQACAFRDAGDKLTDKGIEVIGVSGDSAKNHELFKKHHKLNFTLLADEDGALAKKFGVPLRDPKGGKSKVPDSDIEIKQGVRIARWTVVIDKDGKVIHKAEVKDVEKDPMTVLEVIEKAGK